jgi:choline-sulfatase
MAADPYQTTNIRDENPDRVRVMDHHLTDWLHEQCVKPYAIPDPMQVELRERQKWKQ